MTTPTLNKLLASLPSLSKADLATVCAAADSLLGLIGGLPATSNNPAATPLFDAVTHALGLRLGFAAFQATATYKTFRRGEVAVNDFVDAAFPEACDKVSRNAILIFLVECLMDDLKARHVPLSIGALCNNLERAPQVFRDAFPGYVENGLAHLIFKSMTRRD